MAFLDRIRTRLFGERPDLARLDRAFADHAASQERLQATCWQLNVALRADHARALLELREVRRVTRRMRAESPFAG